MLSIQEMPSTVTQLVPHESRSAKYSHVPTSKVVEWLGGNGFVPVTVQNGKVKKADREGFQRHVVRFRKENAKALSVGDTVPEIVFRNAHDGTSGLSFWAGALRLACLNGLMIATDSFTKVSLPHRGKHLEEKVIDAAFRVIDVSEKALIGVNQWQKIELNQDEKDEFARRALALRFDNQENSPVEHRQLLTVRRQNDTGSDLWTVFNRVQENLMRGGFAGINRRNEQGAPIVRTLRAIRGSDRSIELNTDLWKIADEFAHSH